MKIKYIILGLVILLIILFLVQKKEHITPSSSTKNYSSEAIQNIANIYADTKNTATFNNINITAWKGMITMWSGDVTKIPKGWALCDGGIVNGKQIPDLRGRFILGYGQGKDASGVNLTDRKMEEKGGSETISLETPNIPNHVHNIFAKRQTGDDSYSFLNTPDANTATKIVVSAAGNRGTDSSYALHATWNNPDSTKGETWWGRTSDVGGRWVTDKMTVDPVNTMPPYFVLAYIIKI
jgi:microcystin-dependent protein